MRDTYDAMHALSTELDDTCPKCGGTLRLRRPWCLECVECRMRLSLTTYGERIVGISVVGGLVSVGLVLLLAVVL